MSNFDPKMLTGTLSPEPMNGFKPNLADCKIVMSKRPDYILMTVAPIFNVTT